MPLDRTPLYEEHRRLGARLVPFAGWEMPMQYEGIIAEHQAVRNGAGIFDVSHMGRLRVAGPAGHGLLQTVVTGEIARLAPGAGQYTLICDENGGILDDLVLFHLAPDRFLIVANAVNRVRDREWLERHRAAGTEVRIEDDTFASAMIALQGPAAARLLQPLTDRTLDGLPRFGCVDGTVAGASCLLSRTGYTGEDGFELIVAAGEAAPLWRVLLTAGAVPCGLGARDTLRLEAGYVLYGEDIDASTTPVEAGLTWLVALEKGDFVARAALAQAVEEGPRRKLAGFEMTGPEVGRRGYAIFAGGQEVGLVTSGRYSPTLRKGIGLGYLPTPLAKTGTVLDIMVRGRSAAARVVRRPFYRGSATAAK